MTNQVLEIVEKELDLTRNAPIQISSKGEHRVIQAGVKGQGFEYVEVWSKSKSITEVATEPVAEIVEVGTEELYSSKPLM